MNRGQVLLFLKTAKIAVRSVLKIYCIQTSGLLAELAGADAKLIVDCALLNWLKNHMLILIARDFVLARKKTDWGKSLLGVLLVVCSHQVLG